MKRGACRLLLPGLALMLMLAAGCRSTAYFEERAVNEAREFLLKHAPELSPSEAAFVRFNKPALLTENILPGGWFASSERSQICVSWIIPERENVYMVFGVSTSRMSDWYPNRLIRKTFPPPDRLRLNAYATARSYAQNNLYFELSEAQLNVTRFDNPRIVRTGFAVNDPEKKLAGRTQFSLVWPLPGAERSVVVCGYAADDLAGFRTVFGGLLDNAEIDRSTVSRMPPSRPPEKK